MGLLSDIIDLFKPEPKGPIYTIEDLEFNKNEYWSHIDMARELLMTAITKPKRYMLDVKRNHDEVRPAELLGKVHFTWKWNINSWIDDEFIPKVRQYSKLKNYGHHLEASCKRQSAYTISGREDDKAEAHIKASRFHTAKISEILHFFLCDERAMFDQKASLYNGDCSPREIAEWYIGGKHIVERNFRRIDEALTKVINYIRH